MAKNSRWVHYEIPDTFGRTICDKDDFKVLRTEKPNKVTCETCIEILKKEHWYCEEHGFIDDTNVKFDATCGYCGRTAVA